MKKFALFFVSMIFCSCNTFAANYDRVNVYNSSYTKNISGTVKYIDIVVDYSSSMRIWIQEVKRAVLTLTAKIPGDVQIGVRSFGGQVGNSPLYMMSSKKTLCSKTSQILPVAYNSAKTIAYNLDGLEPGGLTPLTLGLEKSVNVDFAWIGQGHMKKIILITDGYESCGGNPCEFIKNLVKTRNDFVVDVIYTGRNDMSLKCLSDVTNGKFYNVKDKADFENVILESITSKMRSKQVQQDTNSSNQGYLFVR